MIRNQTGDPRLVQQIYAVLYNHTWKLLCVRKHPQRKMMLFLSFLKRECLGDGFISNIHSSNRNLVSTFHELYVVLAIQSIKINKTVSLPSLSSQIREDRAMRIN
jgi:hypothetical protein